MCCGRCGRVGILHAQGRRWGAPGDKRHAVCDGVWRYVVLCGGVWPSVVVCGGVWLSLAVCGGVWRRVAACGGM